MHSLLLWKRGEVKELFHFEQEVNSFLFLLSIIIILMFSFAVLVSFHFLQILRYSPYASWAFEFR